MLQPINHVLTHPDDIPSMPRAAKEYLQVRFNQAYVMESGEYRALRAAGRRAQKPQRAFYRPGASPPGSQ